MSQKYEYVYENADGGINDNDGDKTDLNHRGVSQTVPKSREWTQGMKGNEFSDYPVDTIRREEMSRSTPSNVGNGRAAGLDVGNGRTYSASSADVDLNMRYGTTKDMEF